MHQRSACRHAIAGMNIDLRNLTFDFGHDYGGFLSLGFAQSTRVDEPAALEAALDASWRDPGPTLIVARVGQQASGTRPPRRPAALAYRFRRAIGTLGLALPAPACEAFEALAVYRSEAPATVDQLRQWAHVTRRSRWPLLRDVVAETLRTVFEPDALDHVPLPTDHATLFELLCLVRIARRPPKSIDRRSDPHARHLLM